MNKRIVWNFEANMERPLQLPPASDNVQHDDRWESRFFWPDDQIITLHGLNKSFLDLSNYQIKHRKDTYYLLPDTDYNLKLRRDELLYKPMLMKNDRAVAYGKKIKLKEHPPKQLLPGCNEINAATLLDQIKTQGIEICVEKEALIYKLETIPTCKIELAWLHVANGAYFSVSIESRSQSLVESITRQLLGDLRSHDYVSFLKSILTNVV